MKQSLLLLCGLFLALASHAQRKVTISGYVKDSKSGETLIGATIFNESAGTTTNVYGFYSLSLPPGSYVLKIAYLGYQTLLDTIELQADLRRDFELLETNIQLNEIQITDSREDENVKSIEMSTMKMDIKTMLKMPALLGEVDLVRNLQLLPGVSTVGEGASGFNVRGGGVGENLVLLDEAVVYNSAHLFGFFSVFNPDAVKDVKLIKGGIPAQYGERNSSILDVRMKEGNNKKLTAQGGIGLIFSRLTLEAPIVKNKGSFIVAARRSYIDILSRPFLPENLKGTSFYFYDLTAKANYELGPKDKLYLSAYYGRDVFGADFKFNWGNATTTLRWNHLFSDRLFSNVSAIYSNYVYNLGFSTNGGDDNFDWTSRIISYSLKPQLSYFLNQNNELSFGGLFTLYDFRPGVANVSSAGVKRVIGLEPKYGAEFGVYVSNQSTLSEKFSTEIGFRLSGFSYLGAGEAYTFAEAPAGKRRTVSSISQYAQWQPIKTYYTPEPRVSFKYEVNGSTSLKTSYNRMAQYLHLVSNTTASTPLDVWTPSTNNIRPQIADQIALGIFKNFKQNLYETSVELYYKEYQNSLDYVDGADLRLNRYIEGDLLAGIGRAYGAEFYVKKTRGRFNGWISYTLARTERRVEGVNRGQWFPTRFDRAHNLALVGFYELNHRWSFSTGITFSTGTPATFPTNRLAIQGYVIPHNAFESRNNYRIPNYFRADISATLQGKRKEGRKNQDFWTFSIYNLTARRNPFSIYFQQNPDNFAQTQAIRYSVIGTLVPAVSYNFKF
jgi:hypothetical protein